METEREAHRQLNHVEMVYRLGERELAGRVFELLGNDLTRSRRHDEAARTAGRRALAI